MKINANKELHQYILNQIQNLVSVHNKEEEQPTHITMSTDIYDFLRSYSNSMFKHDKLKERIIFMDMTVLLTREKDTITVSVASEEF